MVVTGPGAIASRRSSATNAGYAVPALSATARTWISSAVPDRCAAWRFRFNDFTWAKTTLSRMRQTLAVTPL